MRQLYEASNVVSTSGGTMRRILTISALLLALARSSATAHAQNLEAPVHPPGQPAGLAQKTSSTSHAPPSWLSIIAPVAGAFAAAWYGARLALRKTLRDLALTGRVQWYEEAIRSIANYEDVLARLRDNYLHEIIIKAQDPLLVLAEAATPAEQRKPTELFRPDRVRWKELVEAEARLRAGLQLHDVYTGGATRTWCAVARGHASLSRSRSLTSRKFLPLTGSSSVAAKRRWGRCGAG